MSAIPYERARSIIKGEKHGTRSPLTMSGNTDAVYSYEKKIAWRKGDQWFVVQGKSTQTTNRHIKAVREVLIGMGVKPTIVDYDTGEATS